MGAGKTTLAAEVALRIGRRFVDLDRLIEDTTKRSIAELFAEGEARFREAEAHAAGSLRSPTPTVFALGGGAVTTASTRELLREHAVTVWIDEDVDTLWQRARDSDRPLARDEQQFRRLYDERRPLYEAVADATARDADDVVLAAAGVHVERGAIHRLGELVPGSGRTALVSDPHVAGIHGMDAQLALGGRLAQTHELPLGE